MLEISNVEVACLESSVIASGNAMRLEPVEYSKEEFEKGIKRLQRLKHASLSSDVHCHHNAITGIRVAFDVKYPQYWTPEFQRYHFADIVTSSSKMHRLCKMEIRKATNKYVSPEAIRIEQSYVDAYNDLINNPDWHNYAYWNTEGDRDVWSETHDREEALYWAFMVMLSNCPLGLELFMRVNTNYMQLQTMYFQRKNHRLKEDWGPFCKMIEELPYFKELISKD